MGQSVLEMWGPDIDSKSVKRPKERALYQDQTHVSQTAFQANATIHGTL